MTWESLRRSAFWKRRKAWLTWGGAFLVMAGAFWLLGWRVPLYGEARLTASLILIVLSIVCAIAFLTRWRAATWKLRKQLSADYGERCCAPMPKDVREDGASAGESA